MEDSNLHISDIKLYINRQNTPFCKLGNVRKHIYISISIYIFIYNLNEFCVLKKRTRIIYNVTGKRLTETFDLILQTKSNHWKVLSKALTDNNHVIGRLI